MACELQVLASLNDLKLCQEYLFGKATDDNTWLLKCIVSVSPFGDRAVIARGSALVALTLQWDKHCAEKNHGNFSVTQQWDCIERFGQKDAITCATFLPIAEKRHHSSIGSDWTCIALGFASGLIAFFTENMDLLIQYQLHCEPLQRIKATSYKKRKSDGHEFPESVYAVYPSVICSFSAFSLFQTLRTTRSELALHLAKGLNIKSDVVLDYKKYLFAESGVRDASFIDGTTTNNFDHLLNSSLRGNYQPNPPQHSVIACTGDNKWLQYLDTSEGVKKIDVTDVAFSVLGNIVRRTGFMKRKEKDEKPDEKLTVEFSLMDRGRNGQSIVLSPDATLLAVTDDLGRVTLADVRTGVALRLWKGCRNAECGFLEVSEDVAKHRKKRGAQHEASSKTTPRIITVIVIYAPKKGLIEMFPVRHGGRIEPLCVSKNGRLIYTPYELLGLNSLPRKSASTLSPVTFLCEDGLMNISVPFHCAFIDASPIAKDFHHLRKLKNWLKENVHAEGAIFEQITSVAKELETNEVRLQTIDFIISVKKISSATLCSMLDVFLEFAQDEDVTEAPARHRDLVSYCKQLKKLIKFYDFLNQLKLRDGPSTESSSQPLTDLLILPESEVKTLIELLNNVQLVSGPKKENKVKFSENNDCDLSTLLGCFDINDSYTIVTKSDLKEEEISLVGDLFFENILNKMSQLEAWTTEAGQSNICAYVFCRCLLIYWLNRTAKNKEQDIRGFIPILKAITTLSEDSVVSPDYNIESSWWTEVRNTIAYSKKPLAALTTAVCCRAVTIMCEQEAELNKTTKFEKVEKINPNQSNVSLDWENISADTWQWDLLISHLEDIAILNAVLSVKISNEANEEPIEISLQEIVSNGESAVSELIAKWLHNFSITPNLLVNKSDVEFQLNLESPEPLDMRSKKLLKGDEELIFPLVEIAEEVQPGSKSEQIVLGHLAMLKKRFPYSLTSSVVLSHLFWNYLTQWQWDLTNIKLLESAIAHLESIPSVHLQIGMGCLAWSTFLKIHVNGITRVAAKLGKLPTDTLCTKELGIPRQQILPLLRCSSQLLGVILDASAQRPLNTFIFRHESIWRDSQPGLIRTAASRALPSIPLVQLHCQVIHIFELLANFDLKNRTLLPSLLDTMKSVLFGELSQQKETIDLQGLNENIVQFLCSAITAAVYSESDSVKWDHSQSVSLKWFQFCLDQASDWRVQLDPLRRHYVCELYTSCYDRLAETVIDDVQETQKLASQLLVIVGQRVNYIMSTSSSPHKVIARLSPSLTSWLKSLNKGGGTGQLSEECDIEIVLHRILHWLVEESPEAKLAGLLLESIPGIMTHK